MSKWVTFLLFFVVFEVNAQLHFTKITDSVFVYTTYQTYKQERISAHGFLKITSAGVVMIDTPWDTTQFQPLLDSVQIKFQQPVVFVLATHWHEDRTAGLEYYQKQGIATYSSVATKNLCRENNFPQAQFSFENDTTFLVGKTNFSTFYPGSGHTSDNIVVYFPSDRILVGGCFVKSIEATDLGNLNDANIGLWPTAAKNLLKTFPQVKTVIPGHQKIKLKGKNAIKHTVRLGKQLLNGRKKSKKRSK